MAPTPEAPSEHFACCGDCDPPCCCIPSAEPPIKITRIPLTEAQKQALNTNGARIPPFAPPKARWPMTPLRRLLCLLGAHRRYRILTIGFDDVQAQCADCGRVYRRDLY